MPSKEISFTVDFKNVNIVRENFKKLMDEVASLRERNIILYSHIELFNKAVDALCPLVARAIDWLPCEQFTLIASTREALDNVTYVQNKEYRENTNPDYYKQAEIDRLTAELARRDEIIRRLKLAGNNMYFTCSDDPYQVVNRVHEAWRVLMKELE